jgi:hypothetical protein
MSHRESEIRFHCSVRGDENNTTISRHKFYFSSVIYMLSRHVISDQPISTSETISTRNQNIGEQFTF